MRLGFVPESSREPREIYSTFQTASCFEGGKRDTSRWERLFFRQNSMVLTTPLAFAHFIVYINCYKHHLPKFIGTGVRDGSDDRFLKVVGCESG